MTWGNINDFDSHRLPSNWIGNASLTWYSPDGHWQVTGFIRNFSDGWAENTAFDPAIVDGSAIIHPAPLVAASGFMSGIWSVGLRFSRSY